MGWNGVRWVGLGWVGVGRVELRWVEVGWGAYCHAKAECNRSRW